MLSSLKKLLSAEPVLDARQTEPGRNEPCPCGSGRKYKRCCQEGKRKR
ncbi:MAG: SEC-C domain-containing protein [Anaerolineales bacterium]|nr:SEC-C domain-containing protein [Anaerolineales bacterium]MCB9127305.1 SEC-C domain-containing protein [Ardenticatenales bacterium]MCB9172594.1 SEC-C domain-containing protein [Ardenticatenales bacterium]